jgi:hypothetical protein
MTDGRKSRHAAIALLKEVITSPSENSCAFSGPSRLRPKWNGRGGALLRPDDGHRSDPGIFPSRSARLIFVTPGSANAENFQMCSPTYADRSISFADAQPD